VISSVATIDNLDSVTQQNASLVEQISSDSEELSNQTDKLLNKISRFKTRDNFKLEKHVLLKNEMICYIFK